MTGRRVCYPNATSSIIIRLKPRAKKIGPLCE